MSEFSTSDKGRAAADAQHSDLEFPVAPHFYSPPPKLSPTEYYQWCEEMRAGHKDDPARLAEKCTVEFVL